VDDVADPASRQLLGNLIAIVLLLLTSAFFTGSEIGFLAVGQTRLRELSEQGSRLARVLLLMHKRRAWVLATILLGITASNYFAEKLATELGITYLGEVIGPAVAFIAIIVIVLIFCEVLPMQFALRRPERFALRAAFPIAIFSALLSPVILLLSGAARALLWLAGTPGSSLRPRLSEEQLKAMIEQGEETGAIPAGQREMLHGVLEFGDQTVAEVMTPRTEMVCVEGDQSLGEALRLGLANKHSRLPVYEENLDNITGIIFLKDLLPYLRPDQMDKPCHTAARPPHYVPESLPIDLLLRQLQARRQMMAIVRDEFGGTAGLVTVEDVLEEIVGDILDEYDVEEPEVKVVGEDELLCDAGVSLRTLQEHLAQELPVEDYDSLGGLVMDLAGRIPQAGERFEWEGLVLVVEDVAGPRLAKIRVIERGDE